MHTLREEIEKGNFDMNLCYCSVYDECWTISMVDVMKRFSGQEVPSREDRKVESCSTMEKSGI